MEESKTEERKESCPERAPERFFVRFSLNQRLQHIVLLVVFTSLSVTGLAERYYTAGWASWLILTLGGMDNVRLIHRGFGAVFTASILYHFGYLLYAVYVRHSRASMVPTLQDFQDVISTLRYSFGMRAGKPRFGRFDYNQKFEYWGLIFGSIIITVTGFVLAFPVAVTRFVSGQVVAASVDFHGFEATLAVLTIVIWHLYDVIFKPDIFPADVTVFTGKISEKRMMEEHPLEYAEITGLNVVEEKPAVPSETPPPAPPSANVPVQPSSEPPA